MSAGPEQITVTEDEIVHLTRLHDLTDGTPWKPVGHPTEFMRRMLAGRLLERDASGLVGFTTLGLQVIGGVNS